MSQGVWNILLNAMHRLCPNILFCNRVHKPLKLFASTFSAFNCSLSCENTVSTLRRFVPEDHQTKVILRQIPESFPVIHGCRGDLKCRNITFQRDQGMHLEAEISLFFGRAPSIICPVRTKGTAITRTSKLADRKGKAVNYKITAGWYGKGL